MKLISPSILSADFANLQTEVQNVTRAGADWIHVDVMDGHFVPNLTIGAPVVAALKKVATLPLDVHLMIENPDRYIEDFLRAGSDVLTLHVESLDPQKLTETLRRIRQAGKKAGLTLKPETPIDAIKPYLAEVDVLLIMTVEPGFSGQSFLMDQIQKLNCARRWIDQSGHRILLEVDGGVNESTIQYCQSADVIVAGNAVFKAPDYAVAIQKLKQAPS